MEIFYFVFGWIRLSPNHASAGKTNRKYAKYSPVNNLLAPTYGAAAARDPKNSRVRNTPANSQNKILCGSAYGAKTSFAEVRLST